MPVEQDPRLMVLLASPFKAERIESVAPPDYTIISIDPHVHEDMCNATGNAEQFSREKAVYKLTTALENDGKYAIAGRVLEQTGIDLFTWPGEVVLAANDVVNTDSEGQVYEKPKDLSSWIKDVENLSNKEINIIGTWVSVPFEDPSRLNYMTYGVKVRTVPFSRDEILERMVKDSTFSESVLKVASGLGLEHSGDLYDGPYDAEVKVNSHGPTVKLAEGDDINAAMKEDRRRMVYGVYPAMFDLLFESAWSVDTDSAAKEAQEFQIASEQMSRRLENPPAPVN